MYETTEYGNLDYQLKGGILVHLAIRREFSAKLLPGVKLRKLRVKT